MKRTLTLLALGWPAMRVTAQRSPANAPVIAAKVSVLGTVRDSSPGRTMLLPYEFALSPRGSLVAYTTSKDLRIWSARTKSTTVVITGDIGRPAWSPTGDVVAFVRTGEDRQSRVWSAHVDPTTGRVVGAPQRVSVSDADWEAPISPDGKQIAFVRNDPGPYHVSIVVVPANGGPERVLVRGYGVDRLRWSADGSSLYYNDHPDSGNTALGVYRVSSSGGSRQLVHQFSGEPGERPWPVAGGEAIALAPRSIYEGSVLLADNSGRAAATVTVPFGDRFADLPTAHALAVRESHPRGLRVVSLTDGKSHTIVDTTAEVADATWFRDGRRIAAIVVDNQKFTLETIGLDGSVAHRLPLKARPFYSGPRDFANGAPQLQVSPDGRYATFVGEGGRSIELTDLENGAQHTLVSGNGMVTPFWRADSKAIRYTRAEPQPTDRRNRAVHEVSLTGDDRSLIQLPSAQYPRVVWGLDENYIVSFGPFGHKLVPLDGGAPIVTARTPIQGAGYISPNRKFIALRVGDINGKTPSRKLVLASLVDSTSREVSLPFLDVGVMAYDADSRIIYIRGREAATGPLNIYAVPVNGSNPRLVTPIDTKEDLGIFEGSPDHRSILYSVAATRSATFVSLDFSEALARVAPKP